VNDCEASNKNVAGVVDILYGLAIGSGLQTVMEAMLAQPDTASIALLGLCSLFVAVADWLLYRTQMSATYRSIARLLTDIAIVVLLFILFEMAGKTNQKVHRDWFTVALSVYFILGTFDYWLFARETGRRTKMTPAQIQGTFALIAAATLAVPFGTRTWALAIIGVAWLGIISVTANKALRRTPALLDMAITR
jgi:hypothetical protein